MTEKEITELVNNQIIKHNTTPKLFYNLAEVSNATGISKLALKGRIKRGTLNANYNDNVILISTSEFKRFIYKIENKTTYN